MQCRFTLWATLFQRRHVRAGWFPPLWHSTAHSLWETSCMQRWLHHWWELKAAQLPTPLVLWIQQVKCHSRSSAHSCPRPWWISAVFTFQGLFIRSVFHTLKLCSREQTGHKTKDTNGWTLLDQTVHKRSFNVRCGTSAPVTGTYTTPLMSPRAQCSSQVQVPPSTNSMIED